MYLPLFIFESHPQTYWDEDCIWLPIFAHVEDACIWNFTNTCCKAVTLALGRKHSVSDPYACRLTSRWSTLYPTCHASWLFGHVSRSWALQRSLHVMSMIFWKTGESCHGWQQGQNNPRNSQQWFEWYEEPRTWPWHFWRNIITPWVMSSRPNRFQWRPMNHWDHRLSPQQNFADYLVLEHLLLKFLVWIFPLLSPCLSLKRTLFYFILFYILYFIIFVFIFIFFFCPLSFCLFAFYSFYSFLIYQSK